MPAGATGANTLAYDLEVSTLSSFARTTISMASTATPRMGNYFRPPKIYDGNARHGVVLRSTQPWAGQQRPPGPADGHHVLFQSSYRGRGTAPKRPKRLPNPVDGRSPHHLDPGGGGRDGRNIVLTWTAPGDDMIYNNLTGNYRIQYSSNIATAWSTSTTPSGAYTTTIATGAVVGAAQRTTVTVTTNDTYYIVIWSQDDVGEWSALSNIANTTPGVILRSVTVTGSPYNFGSLAVGASSVTASGITVTNSGNVSTTYFLSAATTTAGSPWILGPALPAGPDSPVVAGGFHATRPGAGLFGPEDVLTNASQTASGTAYSIDGTQTGVAAGVGQVRTLWFKLDMPTTSATSTSQDITVTLTASP